jgi:nucleotide-binding universal stress UspA family protein
MVQYQPEYVFNSDISFQPSRVVCIPIDGSETCDLAVEWAIDSVLRKDLDLIFFLNVRADIISNYAQSGLDSTLLQNMEDANKKLSQGLLIRWAKKFHDQGFHCQAIALKGDARISIANAIHEIHRKFVVMGNSGQGGSIKRMMLGSVSHHIVGHSPVPVFIVPSRNDILKE